MSFHSINYVELFAANINVWEDEDLSALIPADATAVLLHFESTAWILTMGARKKGSTDNFTQAYLSASQQRYQIIAVDANRVIQIWKEDNTAGRIMIYLAGYFTNDVNVFTNLVDVTPASATGHIPSAVTAAINNLNQKYGVGCGYFDKWSDKSVWYADHADWNLGLIFTIRGWIKFKSVGTDMVPIAQYGDVVNRWIIYFNIPGNYMAFYHIIGGVVKAYYTAPFTPVINTYYYFYISRNNAVFDMRIDGAPLVLTPVTPIGLNNLGDIAGNFWLGKQGALATNFDGYLDDVEIANGVVRDTAVPGSAITPDSYTVFYAPMDYDFNSRGQYSDVDITPYVVGADRALGAILYVYRPVGAGDAYIYIRMKGSTDDRLRLFSTPIGWFVGVDNDKKFQICISDIAKIKVYLAGYFKRNAKFNVNAIDVSIAGLAEQSINVGSGKVGAIIECSDPTNLHTFKLRKPLAPTSVSEQFFCINGTITGCDSSSNVSGQINNDQLDFYLMGTLDAGYKRLVNYTRAKTLIGR